MSKIICDICGTPYLETAKQCPICGSVRPGDVQRVTNEVNSDGKVSTGYTYVKGGRFSKSNVKKRTNGKSSTGNNAKNPAPKGNKNEETKSNRGLVITSIVLFLAIIGVVIYIALRFFAPISGPSTDSTPGIQQDNTGMPCSAMTLDVETVLFEQVGVAKLLEVKTTPEKPLEPVMFRSDNEAVAAVSDKGKITAVAEGTAKITVTCGKISKECVVIIKFPEKPSSAPTQDTTVPQDTPAPNVELRLNRKDITFAYKGESWVLYSGDIAKNLITWSSDDEKIVTFTDGKAVAVGSGMTEVHAEYEGQKVSCTVRCNFKENSGVEGNGGVSEDGGGSGNVSPDTGSSNNNTEYAIYTPYSKTDDFTLRVGESVKLELRDSAGNAVNATWQVSGSGISVSGSTVKGVSTTGYAKVIATYNGKGYECIVRVG